jgi:hypothetical protein
MPPNYLLQFNITNPTRQTKMPKILMNEISSLNKKIASGTKISDATTLTSTAAMRRFQPAR